MLTKKFLKQNDLLAVPMDKSNRFCIMKKSLYADKIRDVVKGPQFEKVVPKRQNAMEPTLAVEHKINSSLIKLAEPQDL